MTQVDLMFIRLTTQQPFIKKKKKKSKETEAVVMGI